MLKRLLVSMLAAGLCLAAQELTSNARRQVVALPARASSTVAAVTLTIGGIKVTPNFAGLAGCCVGLNQINARIPAGVGSGNAVSVVLNIGGKSSNTVTVAVQ
jgi:uncharacterized protein (TIGR03437 family)